MGFLGKLFKSDPPRDAVKRSVVDHADGSQTVRTEFSLQGEPRPVRNDVVTAFDDALKRLGGGAQVMHAMDPARLLGFEHGGPPVWSVGMVEVPGPRPYTLLLTYGFSHVLSPERFREGLAHEFSLAVPAGTPLSPWADALLRHQARYVLTQGADIRPNDCVPFRGVPMTRIPFQPEHHAKLPHSTLVGVLATIDPVLPRIDTAHGAVEVRRLVGIDARELDRVETWSAKGFLEELRRVDPLLLSPLERACWLDDAGFSATVAQRFEREGSDIDAALFELLINHDGGQLELYFPKTEGGRKRLLDALVGRVGFGRRLVALTRFTPPIDFSLRVGPKSSFSPRGIEITGDASQGDAAAVLNALRSGAPSVTLTM